MSILTPINGTFFSTPLRGISALTKLFSAEKTQKIISNLLKKIFGICETKKPEDPGCWIISGGRVEIDLKRAGELSERGGAIRLEGKGLADRMFVTRGENGLFYAYKNKCTHMGRRIDPASGSQYIKRCSVMGSRFGVTGEVVSGPAKGALKRFEAIMEDNKLYINVY